MKKVNLFFKVTILFFLAASFGVYAQDIPTFSLDEVSDAVEDTGSGIKEILGLVVGIGGLLFLAYAAVLAFTGENGDRMKKVLYGGIIGLIAGTILYAI